MTRKSGTAGIARTTREERATSVIVTIAFSIIGVLGDYLLKLASARKNPLGSRWFYVGFAVYASTAFGWVFVMRHLKLATIGVVYSVSMILLLTGIGVVVFREPLNTNEVAGLVPGRRLADPLMRFAYAGGSVRRAMGRSARTSARPEDLELEEGFQPEEPRDLGELAGRCRRDGAADTRPRIAQGPAVLQRRHPLDVPPDRGELRATALAALGTCPSDRPGSSRSARRGSKTMRTSAAPPAASRNRRIAPSRMAW